jgi:hypothetical protein
LNIVLKIFVFFNLIFLRLVPRILFSLYYCTKRGFAGNSFPQSSSIWYCHWVQVSCKGCGDEKAAVEPLQFWESYRDYGKNTFNLNFCHMVRGWLYGVLTAIYEDCGRCILILGKIKKCKICVKLIKKC